MQYRLSFRKAAELGISIVAITALTLAGCGGGGGNTTSQQIYTYTTSAGVGEVLKFDLNTTNMVYSYTVVKTSYGALGVTSGQTGNGSLTATGNGFYTVGASDDNFIQDGKLSFGSSELLSGHLLINTIGGTSRIPVIGVSSPLGQLSQLAGTYNFQGFACSASGVADVTGNATCGTNFGTISVDAAGGLTKCNQGDITTEPATNPCVSKQTRTLQALTAVPGVFDIRDSVTGHIGWFFAATTASGQKVAVMDNDDATAPLYGHAVLSTYANAASAVVSGDYFKNDNEGNERLVTISGTAYSNDLGYSGTITYNSPWNGFSTFSVTSGVNTVSGLSMTSATGVYTHQINGDPQFFASGLKY